MGIFYNKIRVRVRLDRLRANYRLLCGRCGRIMPVIKADAYGHGLAETGLALAAEGADSLAVGTVEEGGVLRRAGYAGRIVSLLGPLDPQEDALLFQDPGMAGFVGDFSQLDRLAAACRTAPDGATARICLKLDTGMSRLGFTPDQVPAVLDRLRDLPRLVPVLAASHLATADEPDQAGFVAEQAKDFAQSLARIRAAYSGLEASLANSGGILAHPDTHFQVQRAGIALYGVNPFRGTAWEARGQGVLPAMEVDAPVASVHPVPAGRTVSYGRTFRADRDMTVAVVAAGYADCYSRSLSGRGFMLLAGERRPILGRVCMQLTAVDVTGLPGVRPGDRAVLLGGEGPLAILPEDLAGWWGTIPYEVFCLLGLNRREHVGGLPEAAQETGEA